MKDRSAEVCRVQGARADHSALDAADWSKGSWERTCKTRLTRQLQTSDCGVACLSMVARVSYEKAHTTFSELGCGKDGKPMVTNFRQMELALREHGVMVRRARWSGWGALQGIGVLKVQVGTHGDRAIPLNRNWHWVVAERHPKFGVVLRDPACPLVALETPPMNVMHQDLSRYRPYGCCIHIVGQGDSLNSVS